jgi:vacuolar iron transporter family protein
MRGCHTYEQWAERETEPQRRIAFQTLAKAEKHHADLWAGRIHALGGPEPTYQGPSTGDANTIASRVGGLGLALRRLELDESHNIAKYAKQLEDLGDEPSIVILKQVIEDEREHYQALNSLIRNRRRLMAQRAPCPKSRSYFFTRLNCVHLCQIGSYHGHPAPRVVFAHWSRNVFTTVRGSP